MAKVSLIVNATAGSANDSAKLTLLNQTLESVGQHIEVHHAQKGDEVGRLASHVIEGKNPVVAAAGGDGTLNAVASAVLRSGSKKTFGVVPLGTLNHFARDAGIPLECEKSVPALLEGIEHPVDVGEVNGEYFLNNSSIGAYPEMVVIRDGAEARGVPKWIANVKAIIRVLRRSRFMRVRIAIGDRTIERRTPLVFIGNNPYEYQGLSIGKRPTLHSGKLGILIPRVVNRAGLVLLALRSLLGLLRGSSELDHYEASEVTIETPEPEMLVSRDGEVTKLRTPLRYRSQSGALRVILPLKTA